MGKKNKIVMIHGLLGSLSYFSPQTYLTQAEVFTPDLLGYGCKRTPPEGQAINVESQVLEIVRLIREIGEPVWLLGHSIGWVAAVLVADHIPELVRGLISVEGNFTLNDAFWCSRIAATPETEWALEYAQMAGDPGAWLQRSEIDATDERLAWASEILSNQSYSTLECMARSIVDVTARPAYLDAVRRVISRGLPLYLVAGERSAPGWDVPQWVMSAARRYVIQAKTGHMMMLEDPAQFNSIVSEVIQQDCEAQFPPTL